MSEEYAKLVDALTALDGYGEGVHVYLLERGFKGIPQRASDCPVAVYLKSETGITFVVNARDSAAILGCTWTRTPRYVADFVRMFDAYRYPELIRS